MIKSSSICTKLGTLFMSPSARGWWIRLVSIGNLIRLPTVDWHSHNYVSLRLKIRVRKQALTATSQARQRQLMRDIQRYLIFGRINFHVQTHLRRGAGLHGGKFSRSLVHTKRISLQIPVHLAQERQGQLTSLAFPYAKQ